mmetsp:Transcript_122291/g.346707  ORF Transcript_122291/g.346707 Transcript_122291/m.346707 type:complete len:176 (+) Transcript_122291:98-625(+)
MANPLVGLAYYPLALWLPLFLWQCVPSTTVQRSALPVTGLIAHSALTYVLKIVWLVALVLCLACVKDTFVDTSSDNTDVAQVTKAQAKEGACAFALNLVLMLAVYHLHFLIEANRKGDVNLEFLKKQATAQGEWTKTLIAADEKKVEKTVPPETKMEPESTEKKEEEDPSVTKRK